MLRHRLRLFDAVVSPTMNYASGTWTLTNDHERMIQSTQRKMLRLIIQAKRRYQKIEQRKDKTNDIDDTKNLNSTEDENEDGQKEWRSHCHTLSPCRGAKERCGHYFTILLGPWTRLTRTKTRTLRGARRRQGRSSRRCRRRASRGSQTMLSCRPFVDEILPKKLERVESEWPGTLEMPETFANPSQADLPDTLENSGNMTIDEALEKPEMPKNTSSDPTTTFPFAAAATGLRLPARLTATVTTRWLKSFCGQEQAHSLHMTRYFHP